MIQHLLTTLIYPLLFTLPVWLVYRWLSYLQKRRKGKNTDWQREGRLFILYFYLVVLGSITLQPQMDLSDAIPAKSEVNLVPFVEIYRKIVEAISCPVNMCMYNVLANILVNILMFVPLGILLPLVSSFIYKWKQVALVALMISAGIEVLQYALSYWDIHRFTDVDDVILNVLGAVIGFFLFRWMNKKEKYSSK